MADLTHNTLTVGKCLPIENEDSLEPGLLEETLDDDNLDVLIDDEDDVDSKDDDPDGLDDPDDL